MARAKELFEQRPELASFGWDQFSTRGDRHSKKFCVYHTVNRPDINGNNGAWLRDQASIDMQEAAKEIITQFDLEILLLTFGDDCKVTIYKDLSFETSAI